MKAKRVLYISYPLLTVSEESAGGAEQMLWALEHEMAARGVHTTVAASAGSRVSGELFSTGEPCSRPDDFERRNREHQDRIIAFIRERAQQGSPFDLVHDKSGSFWLRAAEVDTPVLATLHLPRHFYPAHYFENVPRNVGFNCVSESQARSFSDLRQLLGVAPNGILLDRFQYSAGKRGGLLWLGRICEEKAPHLALEVAQRAHLPITVAGQVYPFSYHRQYFEREVRPRLRQSRGAAFIDSPCAEFKRKLLREASVLLITSQVDETSSLVAMEAAASGTPVIAFRRGALPEIVQHGQTGFVVGDVDEAVACLGYIHTIKPEACVGYAREHFSSASMADAYAGLYEAALRRHARPALLEKHAA
ncbi:MAG TPA: glycosyltransferase [Candidatus Angelobacter sp.]|nr:glycosyltransferase [Candidatus Angelobacter sp.]